VLKRNGKLRLKTASHSVFRSIGAIKNRNHPPL
jgi:hypothetical protein